MDKRLLRHSVSHSTATSQPAHIHLPLFHIHNPFVMSQEEERPNVEETLESSEEAEGAVGGTSPPKVPPKHPPHAFVKYLRLPRVEVEVVNAATYREYNIGRDGFAAPVERPRPNPTTLVPSGDFEDVVMRPGTPRPGTPRPGSPQPRTPPSQLLNVPALRFFAPLEAEPASSEWNNGEDEEVEFINSVCNLNITQ